MSIKIGEALINKGVITRGQLEDALKAQLVFGGHLGTCLIEMNMVDEETLGRTLSLICKAPYAPANLLMDAPERVIRLLTREIAERYQAIPVEAHERTLRLAMIDPGDLRAIEDVGFLTSLRIETMVAPEFRVLQALEKHYEVPRRGRYVKVVMSMEQAGSRARSLVPRLSSRGDAWPESNTHSSWERAFRETAPPSDRGIDSAPADDEVFDETYGYNRNWREVAAHLMGDSRGDRRAEPRRVEALLPATSGHSAPIPASTAPAGSGAEPGFALEASIQPIPGSIGEWSFGIPIESEKDDMPSAIEADLRALGDMLCRAPNNDEAVDAILQFVIGRIRRAFLFSVEGDRVSFWGSAGLGSETDGDHEETATKCSDWMFQLMLGRDHYRGPLPEGSAHARFFAALGLDLPAEILLIPVHVNDRLVGLFYADGGHQGQVRGETSLYFQMIRMFCLALSHIAIRQRIRAMALLPMGHAEPAASTGGQQKPGS